MTDAKVTRAHRLMVAQAANGPGPLREWMLPWVDGKEEVSPLSAWDAHAQNLANAQKPASGLEELRGMAGYAGMVRVLSEMRDAHVSDNNRDALAKLLAILEP